MGGQTGNERAAMGVIPAYVVRNIPVEVTRTIEGRNDAWLTTMGYVEKELPSR